MSSTPKTKEIFLAALGMSAGDRAAYLDSACETPAIRREVDGLLAAFSRAGQFLEPARRIGAPGATDVYRQTPGGPTRTVGRYRILERLGEGGFGVVYRAEQTEPVHRYSALKIVKLGMDTEEVLRRFDAERQTLALMDHPNIATVFDGGLTDGGRPYFVMELAIGQPITAYCDERRLTVRERLQIFLAVCRGVQHAHSKGIVHRDLKPGNVIVVTRDGKPVPKIIDFGIAKALTTCSMAMDSKITIRGALLGTPQYMSPEQTRGESGDVDTRSDVYALGALLFELLTGSTPLESDLLKGRDLPGVMELIRSNDAPSLSARLLSKPPMEREAIAGARRTSFARLIREVRGELEWVTGKALERSADVRYATADAFAEDVERFMNDRPVTAGPRRWTYQVAKFARRHKVWVAAGTAAFVTLLIGSASFAALWLESRTTERALQARYDEVERALRECSARRAALESSQGETQRKP